ncbi:undecaprenyl-phosphate glucose phosphotransferase, partial [Methylobacterium adhaesivum]|nr:undecaprenyl-phosphate glucose phosphotransferase [Methylobacterium adhaesivum]
MPAFDVRDLLQAAGETDRQAAASPVRGQGAAPRREAMSPVVLADCVRVGEFLFVLALGVAVRGLTPTCLVTSPFRTVAAAGSLAILAVLVFQAAGAYRIDAVRRFPGTALRLTLAWTAACLAAGAYLVLAEAADPCTRAWLVALYGIGLGLLLTGRFVLSRIIGAQM